MDGFEKIEKLLMIIWLERKKEESHMACQIRLE
jgi:hypothetical protein